jgi:hypothetical protein
MALFCAVFQSAVNMAVSFSKALIYHRIYFWRRTGHDGQTANTMVCVEARQNCVVILSNDVRSEAGFADLAKFILGDTGVPFDWEYGDRAGRS